MAASSVDRVSLKTKFNNIFKLHMEFVFMEFISTSFDESYLDKFQVLSRGSKLKRHASFSHILPTDDEIIERRGEELGAIDRPAPLAQLDDSSMLGIILDQTEEEKLIKSCGKNNESANSTKINASGSELSNLDNSIEKESENKECPTLEEDLADLKIHEAETKKTFMSQGNSGEQVMLKEEKRNCEVSVSGAQGPSTSYGGGGDVAVAEMTYCMRIPAEKFHDVGQANKAVELRKLIQAIINDVSMSESIKDKIMRGFWREHPHLFREVLGEDVLQLQLWDWNFMDKKSSTKVSKAFGRIRKIFKR